MSDPTIEPLPPGATLAPASDGVPRYVVEHVLGRGGFAITYVARDTRLNGTVVVKELACAAFARRAHDGRTIEPTRDGAGTHAALVDAAIREARTLNTLRDPRIVRVTDVFRENGTAYACMDRVVDAAPLPIGPLGRALTSANARRIEAVARGLLGALDVVHRAGIVHGDVKPDNVLVDAEQHVVLIDFGAARRPDTGHGAGLGRIYTRGYAAPEVVGTSSADIGPYSDLYAWGMLVWGLVLSHGDVTPAGAHERQAHDHYADGSATLQRAGVSPPWADAIAWSIALDPGSRPQSVSQLFEALGHASLAPDAPDDDDPTAPLPTSDAPTVLEPGSEPPPTWLEGAPAPAALPRTTAEPAPSGGSGVSSGTEVEAPSRDAAPINGGKPRPAGLGLRVVAMVVDLVISAAAFVLGVWWLGRGNASDELPIWVVFLPLMYGLFLSVYSCAALIGWGATPGLAALRLSLVDERGERPDRAAVIVRVAVAWLSTLALGLGFAWVALSRRRLAWHDAASGTRVVRRPPAS